MNNRYICRGKRKDNGEWVEGYYSRLPHQFSGFLKDHIVVSSYDIESETGICNAYPVVRETVGRCTGLKDKNGKLIFEGDVLYDKESGFVGTVKFNDIIASFVVVINDTTPTFYHWSWLNKGDVARSKNLKNTEVIGNEFDNPELPEVER